MMPKTTPQHAETTRILVTGFGPFPGVPDNASGSLATSLAGHPDLARHGLTVSAVVLPTVWGEATARFSTAVETHRPDHVVSFGVSRFASGFTVETMARNVAAKIDAAGMPPPDSVLPDRARRLQLSTLPARELVRRLRDRGHPATRSLNAGRYLCNALLFHGLGTRTWRRSQLFGFVHIPARVACDTIGGVPSRLDWTHTVRGGVALLRTVAELADEPPGAA